MADWISVKDRVPEKETNKTIILKSLNIRMARKYSILVQFVGIHAKRGLDMILTLDITK